MSTKDTARTVGAGQNETQTCQASFPHTNRLRCGLKIYRSVFLGHPVYKIIDSTLKWNTEEKDKNFRIIYLFRA